MQRRNTEKPVSGSKGGSSQGNAITIMHQEGISKSSQGHQPMGPIIGGLTINSPKYQGTTTQ